MPETIISSPPHLKTGLPRAPEAEKACLGALILDSDGLSKIEGILEDKDFFEELHRRIHRSIKRLFTTGRSIDLVTLHNEIQADPMYQGAGGMAYLTDLMEKVGTQAHLADYARIVREKAMVRELLRTTAEIEEECYREENRIGTLRPNAGAKELLEKAEAKIFRLAQERAVGGFVKMSDLVHPLMQSLERQKTTHLTGLATGFAKLDEFTSGLQKSDFIIIGARPNQGKTALALNLAAYTGLTLKQPVAIFSLEMTKPAITQRMLCAEAGVDAHDLRRGFLKRERYRDLTNAASRLLESDIFIDDTSSLTCLEVRSRARRLVSSLRAQGKELSLVIIDYLQLLRSSEKMENRQQEVSEISRSLKALARDLEVPLVALSQFSRRPEERDRSGRPQLSDLRESGSLEQDADLVLMIHRPNFNKQNATPQERAQTDLIIGKQRNGPSGVTVSLTFLDYCTRFVEPAPDTYGSEEASETVGEG
ncbi:MAG: replicative DNA helicase [Elusimicrobia bacterium]|nr:replicative DNA helicase [Elusimicrobiota bacterium]